MGSDIDPPKLSLTDSTLAGLRLFPTAAVPLHREMAFRDPLSREMRQQLHSRVLDERTSGRTKSIADPSHHDVRPFTQQVSADTHDEPAAALQFRGAVDVPCPLNRISPVLRAVELDADFPPLPTHVDARQHAAPVVEDLNLCLGPRQPRTDQRKSRPALLGRLRARVYQRKHPT